MSLVVSIKVYKSFTISLRITYTCRLEYNYFPVGNSAVGKSAITQSFATDGIQFPKSYTMVSNFTLHEFWLMINKLG